MPVAKHSAMTVPVTLRCKCRVKWLRSRELEGIWLPRTRCLETNKRSTRSSPGPVTVPGMESPMFSSRTGDRVLVTVVYNTIYDTFGCVWGLDWTQLLFSFLYWRKMCKYDFSTSSNRCLVIWYGRARNGPEGVGQEGGGCQRVFNWGLYDKRLKVWCINW